MHWWTTFNDAMLTSLVERAMSSNLDVQQAQARIRQARAARGVAFAGLWPTVDATADVTRSRSVGSSSLGTVAAMNNLFHTGLDAAWEADIFGGVRRTIEAADADVQANIEDYRNILVTLVAEVALNYIDLCGFRQEIIIAENNLHTQQRSAEITRKRLPGRVGKWFGCCQCGSASSSYYFPDSCVRNCCTAGNLQSQCAARSGAFCPD